MTRRPQPPPGEDAPPEGRAHVADRAGGCVLEREAERQVRRERRGQDAARSVEGARVDPPVVEDPEPPAVPEQIADPVARAVPPGDHHRARAQIRDPARRLGPVGFAPNRDSGELRSLLEVRSHDVAQGQEAAAKRPDAVAGKKLRPARRREDRVQDDVAGMVAGQRGRHGADVTGVTQHPDLHRRRREIGEYGVELLPDETGRKPLDRDDPAGVLGRARDDDGGAVQAVSSESQEVRLYPGAAPRIGARDGQHADRPRPASGPHPATLADGSLC